jgi:hypothetical protein
MTEPQQDLSQSSLIRGVAIVTTNDALLKLTTGVVLVDGCPTGDFDQVISSFNYRIEKRRRSANRTFRTRRSLAHRTNSGVSFDQPPVVAADSRAISRDVGIHIVRHTSLAITSLVSRANS